MNAKKKAEGMEHIRLAEKALKTSLMKWTPDYDSAGDEFSRAATAFKVAKCHDEALDALSRACDNYKEIRSLYQAAKMLEQSVLICRDINRLEAIVDLAERGGLLYRQHGSPESASQLLEKAAKILETKHPDQSLSLYAKAAETIMVEDRPKIAAEYMAKVARLQTKIGQYNEASESCKRCILLFQEAGFTNTSGRIVAGYVLLQLALEDSIAASKVYHDWGGHCDSDQRGALQMILQAYEDEDGTAAKTGLNCSAMKNLDVEFAILARSHIKLPEGEGIEAAAAARAAENKRKIDAEPKKPSSDDEEEELSEKPTEIAKPVIEDEEDDEDALC